MNTLSKLSCLALAMALLTPLSMLQAQPNRDQAELPRSLTLEQAIEYAIENNIQVKNQRLEIGISDAQVKEVLAQGYPQLNVNGNLTYNIKVPTSFLPAQVFDPEAPEGQFIPVQFGVPYTSNVSLSANQLIFNGSFFVGLQASKTVKELTQKNLEKAEVDVAESVALAYYGALVAKERLNLLQANTARLDSLLRDTQAMYENGFAEKIDVQRVQVNRNNVRTQYQNIERTYAINLNMLKFLVGMPVGAELQLQESIADFSVEPIVTSDYAYADRVEYQRLQINRELAKLDVKNNRIQYYPNLNAFYNIGYNAGKPTFSEMFQSTADFEDQDGNLQEVSTWNQYSAVGLNVNIPIFDGFLKANRIRRSKLVLEQTENFIRNTENQIDLEVAQARINLQNSLESLDIQQENMALAQEVFRVSKIKYTEGVGSNLEVIEAENSYVVAETQYYEALYNALVARVAYQKATGTLR